MVCAVERDLAAYLKEQDEADRLEAREEHEHVELLSDRERYFAFIGDIIAGLDEQTLREQMTELVALRYAATAPAAAKWDAAGEFKAWCDNDDEVLGDLIGQEVDKTIREQDEQAAQDEAEARADARDFDPGY